MKKIILVTSAFICMVILGLAFTKADPPKYKNLKILPKDISEKDLDSIMHHYTASLGVKCNFCHVKNEQQKTWDYASDAKTDKLVARKMMKMTNAINNKYFKDEDEGNNKQNIRSVTCHTCHHGEELPVGIPLHKGEENKKEEK